jgi:hypothetical protein
MCLFKTKKLIFENILKVLKVLKKCMQNFQLKALSNEIGPNQEFI